MGLTGRYADVVVGRVEGPTWGMLPCTRPDSGLLLPSLLQRAGAVVVRRAPGGLHLLG